MSEYLLNLIRKDLEFPTPEEFYARLRKLKPVKLGGSAADLIRAERAERERELARRIDRGRRRVSAARKRS